MAELVPWNFKVTIDGFIDLGSWDACTNLTAEYEVEDYAEGGVNDYTHKLPGRLKYESVQLTRTVSNDAWKTYAWFSAMQTAIVRSTMAIEARAPSGDTVATWNLIDVVPFKWVGPSWDIHGNLVPTEELHVHHQGFMPDFAGVPGMAVLGGMKTGRLASGRVR